MREPARYAPARKLLDKIKLLDETLFAIKWWKFIYSTTFVSKVYNEQVKVQILNAASIDYIIDSDRFAGSLIYASFFFSFFNFNTPSNKNGFAPN